MDKINIIKTNLDFWKTMSTNILILSITLSLGAWQTKAADVPNFVILAMGLGSVLFVFFFAFSAVAYYSAHKKLIVLYKQRNKF